MDEGLPADTLRAFMNVDCGLHAEKPIKVKMFRDPHYSSDITAWLSENKIRILKILQSSTSLCTYLTIFYTEV